MTNVLRVVASSATLAVLIACESPRSGAESALAPHSDGIQAMSFANSEWSEPVNLGATINSSAGELQPALSPDGLSLFFNSNRTGGLGLGDIWVARRECADCPWGTPVNVTALNSSSLDGGPALSRDGHLLFFHSGRPGGQGDNDIYMSRRANPNDDFAWEPPTLLGDDVNTALLENKPFYLQSGEAGAGNLYFNRGPASGVLNDLYYAPVTRDGETRGPAVLIAELSDAATTEMASMVRADGRELFFVSDRVPSVGLLDMWVSTRRSVHEPWSAPENLGAPMNSAFSEQHPYLSRDGRTLVFTSTRPGGFGGNDLWMSTRTPSGN